MGDDTTAIAGLRAGLIPPCFPMFALERITHSEVGAESALDVGEAPACHRAG
jgi:hypothetical protein